MPRRCWLSTAPRSTGSLAAKLAPPPDLDDAEPGRAQTGVGGGGTETDGAGRADAGRRGEGAGTVTPAEPSVAERVLESTAFKSFVRSAATVIGREITRSLLGTGRRRRRR